MSSKLKGHSGGCPVSTQSNNMQETAAQQLKARREFLEAAQVAATYTTPDNTQAMWIAWERYMTAYQASVASWTEIEARKFLAEMPHSAPPPNQ